jgi:predicted nucleic acid-binding protein
VKYLLLDTCVWINLFSRPKLASISDKLIDLLDSNSIKVLMPEMVAIEINRHKEKLEEKYVQASIAPLKNASSVLKDYSGEDIDKCKVLLIKVVDSLSDNNAYVLSAGDKINKILSHRNTIDIQINDEDYKEVVHMGINKKAPFIKNKNSVADAVIVCTFKKFAQVKDGECILVTENKTDFSDTKDERKIHPEISAFIGCEFDYSINIADVINKIEPDAVSDEMIEIVEETVNQIVCEEHDFQDGCWRPSHYGGLTWHKICQKCGSYFDTGESYD